MRDSGSVCVYDVGGGYPLGAPFHPDMAYPEYPFATTGPTNAVYRGMRESLRLLGWDATRYDTAEWDPLGVLVRPGDRVVIKPNLIWHSRKGVPDEWEQVITHGSVVRAIIDYVLIALRGSGEVVIADGPQLDADWESIVERTGLAALVAFYAERASVPVRLLDLRDSCQEVRGDVKYAEHPLPGDPAGATVVDLGDGSRLAELGPARFYGADYDQEETNRHHSQGRHEYRLSATVMGCDVLIDVPKMKTHKKTGVTLALKNLVGVNSGRNWLPHYRDGAPEDGGDQFDRASARARAEGRGVRGFQRLVARNPHVFAPVFRIAKVIAAPLFGRTATTVRSGNWHGNDTCWRMVHDVSRAVLYFDAAGARRESRRRTLVVVDGVVAGEGSGPEDPTRRDAGVLVVGASLAETDLVCTQLMGFDPHAIPMVHEAFTPHRLPLGVVAADTVTVCSNRGDWVGRPEGLLSALGTPFACHAGWRDVLCGRSSSADGQGSRKGAGT